MLTQESQSTDGSWHETELLKTVYLLIGRLNKDGSEYIHSLFFVNRFIINRPARLMASTMSVSTTAAA